MANISSTGNNQVIGITKMTVHHTTDDVTRVAMELAVGADYDTRDLIHQNWQDIFPGNVIVKCVHCGQFSARKTECKYCGAPVG